MSKSIGNDSESPHEFELVGHVVSVTIEIPRWSFAKYALDEYESWRIEFISPLPCPFNYGFVAGLTGGDKLPLDAIVMGARLPQGSIAQVPVATVIHFVDNDEPDNKLVCTNGTLSAWELTVLRIGFPVYVRMKRFINWWKGKTGRTYSNGMSL